MAERGLHIGIDARELGGHPTGVGRYLSGLMSGWRADRAPCHRFTLFSPQPRVEGLDPSGSRFSLVHVPSGTLGGTWWEQAKLAGPAARAGIDVWFSPGYTAPLHMHCPVVVAIHDVSFFAHPEWFGWREGWRRRWLTRASARRAHSVVTISEFSATEIVRWLGINRDRIRLAPPGAPDGPPLLSVRREPLVLFVGSLFNRRRLPDMLRAFALTVAQVPEARLILVGDNRTYPHIDPLAMASALGLARHVEWRAYVPDTELGDLYDRARVFLFLSEYEGFAMTPLEALAHGVPPVLLDTPVSREIYTGAARISVGDPHSISEALVELLTDDAAHAQAMEAGRARLARYSWAGSAQVVLRALEAAVR